MTPRDEWEAMSYKKRKAFTLALVARFGAVCCICGLPIKTRKDLTCQHVTPRSKGGATTFENCRPAHAKCNYGLRDRVSQGPAGIIHDGLKSFTTRT